MAYQLGEMSAAVTLDVSEFDNKMDRLPRKGESVFKKMAGLAAAYFSTRQILGYTVQDYCESHGYGVVRELTGHGIGKEMHEDPKVPNYGSRGNGTMLKAGMCIAIEPMITMGDRNIWLLPDKWSIVTRDGKPAAHFEHTIAIRKGKAEILSDFEEIEKVLHN